MKLSVIVAALNEQDHLGRCLSSIRETFQGEIIVVDGESSDRTVEIARQYASDVVIGSRGLALQCNLGAERATGDVLFFLAADTLVPPEWEGLITNTLASPYVAGGGFALEIDDESFAYRVISWGGNFRSRYLGIALSDQGLFVRKAIFSRVGGMKVDSMIPHAHLCFAIKAFGDFILLREPVKSSARKWRKNGVIATTVKHMVSYMKFRFREL